MPVALPCPAPLHTIITPRLHMPDGVPAPCTDAYASAILNDSRDLPLALSYILPP